MSERSQLRLFVLRVLVAALLVTLFGRLWFLQVHDAEGYQLAASANQVREVVQPAPRGEVYDANGVELVRNRTALVVSVSRGALLQQPDDGRAVLDRLSSVLGRPAAVLSAQITPCGRSVPPPCWRGSPYQPVPVQEYDASDPEALASVLRIEEHREDFPGVTAEFAAVRDYPAGELAAHLLGYLGPVSPEEAQR
ncbi:MAG: Peptidoglycan glycosyltransferase, partial [Frankiales bacterium]|nr:Peptidoglycan glycosyltransferase [Frankiales bacterium]